MTYWDPRTWSNPVLTVTVLIVDRYTEKLSFFLVVLISSILDADGVEWRRRKQMELLSPLILMGNFCNPHPPKNYDAKSWNTSIFYGAQLDHDREQFLKWKENLISRCWVLFRTRHRDRQTDTHGRMGILGLATVHRTSARQQALNSRMCWLSMNWFTWDRNHP